MDLSRLYPGDSPSTTAVHPEENVEYDEDCLPKSFCVLPMGTHVLHVDGIRYLARFYESDLYSVMSWYWSANHPLPVDCEHFVHTAADAEVMEEKDFLDRIPGEQPVAGWIVLEERHDAIWGRVEHWVPRAKLLFANEQFRYISPVLRGCLFGQFRISSVALTNNPACVIVDFVVGRNERKNGRTEFSML